MDSAKETIWASLLKVWPVLLAIAGGIAFAYRQEGRINVMIERLKYQEQMTLRLAQDRDAIKQKLEEQGGDIREIKTILFRIDKKLDQ